MNTSAVNKWESQQLAQGLSLRTVEERSRVLRRLRAGTGADPVTVDSATLARWLAGQPWSQSTRATYDSYLRCWFGWVRDEELRADDPMPRRKPKAPRRQARPVTDAHLRRLLATRMHKRTRVMILLCSFAGLRVHEVAKLRGEDVDLVARQLHVVGKGGVAATIPLHPLLVAAAGTMPRTGWWFPTHVGNRNGPAAPILGRSVSSIVGQAMRRAGIPRGTAHRLRHWYATHLVDSGTDLATTQSLLRHASIGTTQLYVLVGESKRVRGVNRLNPWRDDDDGLAAA
jgi:integrase